MDMTSRELYSVNFLNIKISWICEDCQSVWRSFCLALPCLAPLPSCVVCASDLCLNHFQDQGLILLTRAGIQPLTDLEITGYCVLSSVYLLILYLKITAFFSANFLNKLYLQSSFLLSLKSMILTLNLIMRFISRLNDNETFNYRTETGFNGNSFIWIYYHFECNYCVLQGHIL